MKFAVVNFPAVDFAAVVAATVDTADSVGGDLYATTASVDVTDGFWVEFFVWFFSLLYKHTILCRRMFLLNTAARTVPNTWN